jgi:hypothetical protein
LRFSDYHNIPLSQHELDFVDIPLETDIQLFIDPYAISIRDDPWFIECNNILVEYFALVLEAIRSGRENDAISLLRRLSEPNQTHFGFSGGRPAGRGIGAEQSIDLYERLRDSRAAVTGFLRDLADCELVIPGIARDKISDITTNIIKVMLLTYTADQCGMHGISTRDVPQSFWHPPSRSWRSDYVPLPVVTFRRLQEPIILVPKIIARCDMAYDAHEYYRDYVLQYLQAEYVDAGSSLVHVLKNGKRVVYKKDLKALHPYSKRFLYQFSRDHPDVLQRYKSSVAPTEAITVGDIEAVHPEPREVPLEDLCRELRDIPPGIDAAEEYHRKILGILQALFYPELWRFRKEVKIHEGRKRVDIACENSAREGFFFTLNTLHRVMCPYILFECKNYSSDPGNPELDQLNGRFSPRRGQFGMLICRTVADKNAMLARCKDLLHDHGSHVLVIDDEDICALLAEKQRGGERAVSDYLNDLLRRLVF